MERVAIRRDAVNPQEVPIVLTGYVQCNDAPSFCRDGADFLLETVGWHRRVRVAAEAPKAVRALTEAAESEEAVVVSGSLRRGAVPGCDLLEVHTVYPVDRFVSSYGPDSATALWQGDRAGSDQASGEHASVG